MYHSVYHPDINAPEIKQWILISKGKYGRDNQQEGTRIVSQLLDSHQPYEVNLRKLGVFVSLSGIVCRGVDIRLGVAMNTDELHYIARLRQDYLDELLHGRLCLATTTAGDQYLFSERDMAGEQHFDLCWHRCRTVT